MKFGVMIFPTEYAIRPDELGGAWPHGARPGDLQAVGQVDRRRPRRGPAVHALDRLGGVARVLARQRPSTLQPAAEELYARRIVVARGPG